MAWRGRGRGRGFGFGGAQGFRPAKEDPFVLFPDDVVLPEHPHVRPDDPLITKKLALEGFYQASVYYIKDKNGKSMLDSQDAEIERYSDRNKPAGSINGGSLSDFIRLNSTYLPPELFEGSNMKPQARKRPRRWDTDSDSLFDRYEKLEGKFEGREKKDGEDKKDDEDENEAVSEEEEVEESDDGDYNQNFDFDDDEDDLNMEEDDNDEPVYDD